MKNIKQIIIFTAVTFTLFLTSCDISNVTDFAFQFVLRGDFSERNITLPNVSSDSLDLNKNKDYKENEDIIDQTEILHFNYWFEDFDFDEEIIFGDTLTIDNLFIDSLKFDVQFTNSLYRPIEGERYHLKTFRNMKVADYYRTAKHVVFVEDSQNNELVEAFEEYETFLLISDVGALYHVTEESDTLRQHFRINYFKANVDLTVRVNTSQ